MDDLPIAGIVVGLFVVVFVVFCVMGMFGPESPMFKQRRLCWESGRIWVDTDGGHEVGCISPELYAKSKETK